MYIWLSISEVYVLWYLAPFFFSGPMVKQSIMAGNAWFGKAVHFIATRRRAMEEITSIQRTGQKIPFRGMTPVT